jgi:3-dehydroquinate dehydratase II
MRVLLVHGPNLNRLGTRNPAVYGTVTLDEIARTLTTRGAACGMEILVFQSNHEGVLIDWLQAEAGQADGVVINPGALAHYSVALRDALEDTGLPVVEVHISEPQRREAFRHAMVTASAADRVISGKGIAGYVEALDLVRELAGQR